MASCSTQKKRSEMSGLAKFYDNLTAKYNGYFNAREILNESVVKLDQQHQDNYNSLLPVYEYTEADNPQALASELDEAIKKVSIVVNLHRTSAWVDDCYLLVGQAQYLKQDYETAEETLRFMVNEFTSAKLAKRNRKLSVKKANKSVRKKKRSKSSSKKKTKSEDTKTTTATGKPKLSAKEKKQLSKQREKDRKRYNKQVKKNRKIASRSKGKSKKKGSKPAPSKEALALENKTPANSPTKAPEKSNKQKKAEKKEEDSATKPEPNNYFMKHRPAYQVGVLWLAKTLIERDKYDNALRLIAQLENDPKTFKDVRRDVAAVKAHYYIARKDYTQAIPALENAIELANKRSKKARYAFIIAQIHQKAGRNKDAYAAFERVLKLNPPYEMEFTSKLNLTKIEWINGQSTIEDAKKALAKMLKDDKNVEYKDKIYFTLAEIELRQGNQEEAIAQLNLALENGGGNKSQAAETYLLLANLYFEKEDFVKAKENFDKALANLPKTDERYASVEAYSKNLTGIAENLKLIELQDSLLRISKMPEEERKALALLIKKEQDEKKRAEIAKKASNPFPGRRSVTPIATAGGGGALKKESSFFAYNDRSVKRGKREFTRKWGSRELVDNWRLSNKAAAGDLEDPETVEEVADQVLTDDDVKKILKDVPSSPEEIAKSEISIKKALYELGLQYKERIERNDKAIESWERLDKDYPSSNYELNSWYYLYITLEEENKPAEAKVYKDKIIEKYPNTNFAKILIDPNFAENILDEERKLNDYYDDAYNAFEEGQYVKAQQMIQQVTKLFGAGTSLQPRFALLNALCTGNVSGKDAYVKALKEVVAKYPSTEEQKRAREILRFLGFANAALPGQQKVDPAKTKFKVEANRLHYILIVFNEDVKINDQKVALSNFNLKYHKLSKLRISPIYLGTSEDNRKPMLVVRRFKNQADAMKYFDGSSKNPADFIDSSIDFEVFAITQNNYRQVLRNKTLDGYAEFFELNYK